MLPVTLLRSGIGRIATLSSRIYIGNGPSSLFHQAVGRAPRRVIEVADQKNFWERLSDKVLTGQWVRHLLWDQRVKLPEELYHDPHAARFATVGELNQYLGALRSRAEETSTITAVQAHCVGLKLVEGVFSAVLSTQEAVYAQRIILATGLGKERHLDLTAKLDSNVPRERIRVASQVLTQEEGAVCQKRVAVVGDGGSAAWVMRLMLDMGTTHVQCVGASPDFYPPGLQRNGQKDVREVYQNKFQGRVVRVAYDEETKLLQMHCLGVNEELRIFEVDEIVCASGANPAAEGSIEHLLKSIPLNDFVPVYARPNSITISMPGEREPIVAYRHANANLEIIGGAAAVFFNRRQKQGFDVAHSFSTAGTVPRILDVGPGLNSIHQAMLSMPGEDDALGIPMKQSLSCFDFSGATAAEITAYLLANTPWQFSVVRAITAEILKERVGEYDRRDREDPQRGMGLTGEEILQIFKKYVPNFHQHEHSGLHQGHGASAFWAASRRNHYEQHGIVLPTSDVRAFLS